MNNEKFKNLYKNYEERNRINISNKLFSRYTKNALEANFFQSLLFLFFTTFFCVHLIFYPSSFLNEENSFSAIFGSIAAIISIVMLSSLLSAPLSKILLPFISNNMKLEKIIGEHIYTGELEDIFNIENKIVANVLKTQKDSLLNEIRNIHGVKGTTILKIFHEIQKEKIKILNKNKNVEYSSLELSPKTIEKINYIQKIGAIAEISHYEKKLANQEHILMEVKKSTDDRKNSVYNIENIMTYIEDTKQHLEYLKKENN